MCNTITTIIRSTGAAALVATLAFGAAEAAQMKAATGPQPGDCKQGYEMAFAANPQIAQHMWQQAVAAKHGNKWAIWAGAKNKSVIAQNASGGVQFRALAQPCFYHPVP